MLFNLPDDAASESMIDDTKREQFDIKVCPNSYQVKFDLQENFDNDNFFQPPKIPLSVHELRMLGRIIKELIEFHYRTSNADQYFFVAEHEKLKRFYNRLAKMYAEELGFVVRNNLGEEGLGYEIRTPSHKN